MNKDGYLEGVISSDITSISTGFAFRHVFASIYDDSKIFNYPDFSGSIVFFFPTIILIEFIIIKFKKK